MREVQRVYLVWGGGGKGIEGKRMKVASINGGGGGDDGGGRVAIVFWCSYFSQLSLLLFIINSSPAAATASVIFVEFWSFLGVVYIRSTSLPLFPSTALQYLDHDASLESILYINMPRQQQQQQQQKRRQALLLRPPFSPPGMPGLLSYARACPILCLLSRHSEDTTDGLALCRNVLLLSHGLLRVVVPEGLDHASIIGPHIRANVFRSETPPYYFSWRVVRMEPV